MSLLAGLGVEVRQIFSDDVGAAVRSASRSTRGNLLVGLNPPRIPRPCSSQSNHHARAPRMDDRLWDRWSQRYTVHQLMSNGTRKPPHQVITKSSSLSHAGGGVPFAVDCHRVDAV